MPVMPLGKHKGEDISEVPKSYLEWLIDQDWPSEYLLRISKEELDRRKGFRPAPPPAPAAPARPPQQGELSIGKTVHPATGNENARFEHMMKEQHAFAMELEIVRDNRTMFADILDRGERAKIEAGQGNESVKRLCTAVRRILGMQELDLNV